MEKTSDVSTCLRIIHNQLDKYYAGCIKENRRPAKQFVQLENDITLKLLPRIEALVVHGICNDEEHTYAYKVSNEIKALIVDGHGYCNFTGMGDYVNKRSLPPEDLNFIDEGITILNMIYDLREINDDTIKAFIKTYYEPPLNRGLSELTNRLESYITSNNCIYLEKEGNEAITAFELDNKMALSFLQFINTNKDRYGFPNGKYENSTVFIDNQEVKRTALELRFDISKRHSELCKLNFMFRLSDGRGLEMEIHGYPDSLKKDFGKLYDKNVKKMEREVMSYE